MLLSEISEIAEREIFNVILMNMSRLSVAWAKNVKISNKERRDFLLLAKLPPITQRADVLWLIVDTDKDECVQSCWCHLGLESSPDNLSAARERFVHSGWDSLRGEDNNEWEGDNIEELEISKQISNGNHGCEDHQGTNRIPVAFRLLFCVELWEWE